MKRRFPIGRVSYGIAILVGGLAGWWIPSRGPTESPDQGVERVSGSPGKRKPEGKQLLEGFVHRTDGLTGEPGRRGRPALARYEALLKTTAVSKDPAKDFQKLYEDYLSDPAIGSKGIEQMAMLGVMLDQWVQVDPKSAFAFFERGMENPGPKREVGNTFLGVLAEKLIAKHGLAALVESLPPEGISYNMAPVIFGEISKNGTIQDLKWLMGKSPAQFTNSRAAMEYGGNLPLTSRDELLAAGLDPGFTGAALAGMMGKMGESGGEWLLASLRDGTIPEDVRKAMEEGPLGRYYDAVKGLSIEQRLSIMAELGTLRDGEDRTKNEMIFNSLRRTFDSWSSESDLLYKFRHGALDARETVELASQETPDPGKHAGEYNSQMFRTLAEENLPAALELLAGMPPGQQEKEKAYAARWWFRDSNPSEFYRMAESVDTGGDESMNSLMQDAWNDKAYGNLQRFGSGYLEWVKSLPDGPNKTRALKSIQVAGGTRFSNLSKEAGNLLKR